MIEVRCACGEVYFAHAQHIGGGIRCRRCGAILEVRSEAPPGMYCCRAAALNEAEDDLGSARGFEFMHATCANCGAHWLRVFCVTTEMSGLERISDGEASEMLHAHGAHLKTVMQAWADQHL